MTIPNGVHCYACRCDCGKTGSGYPSESAAARAERHHCDKSPAVHAQPKQVAS